VLSNQTVLGAVNFNHMTPGGNDSVYGVVYMGMFEQFDHCRDEIGKYAKLYNFTSFTHFGQYINKQGDWSNMCYARIGVIINDNFESSNIGWFGYTIPNATSANIFDFECERNFEHLNVVVNPIHSISMHLTIFPLTMIFIAIRIFFHPISILLMIFIISNI